MVADIISLTKFKAVLGRRCTREELIGVYLDDEMPEVWRRQAWNVFTRTTNHALKSQSQTPPTCDRLVDLAQDKSKPDGIRYIALWKLLTRAEVLANKKDIGSAQRAADACIVVAHLAEENANSVRDPSEEERARKAIEFKNIAGMSCNRFQEVVVGLGSRSDAEAWEVAEHLIRKAFKESPKDSALRNTALELELSDVMEHIYDESLPRLKSVRRKPVLSRNCDEGCGRKVCKWIVPRPD